jgi:hypothetical protein
VQATAAMFEDSFDEDFRKRSTGNGAVIGVAAMMVYISLKVKRP